MTAASFTPMSSASAMRRPRHPMSVRVALLAQTSPALKEDLQTEVMVYRQPASDVPVPASWQPPKPAPVEPMDTNCDDEDGYDEDMVGWESAGVAGVSIDRLEALERHTEPRRIAAKRRQSAQISISILLLCGVVTCTLVGWVALV